MDANETQIYYSVLITGILLGGIILYFGFAVIRYQSRRLGQQRGYFLTEIDLLEKDRTRIAHDLHDELGPLLTVAQFHIRSFSDDPQRGLKHLEDADRNIQQILEKLGAIARGLTPRSLHMKGLYFALKDFIEQLQFWGKIPVYFEYEVESPIPSNIGIHIYRIVQELLHNALKHSEAAKICVIIREKKRTICIFCRDNGKGFSVSKVRDRAEGIGLRSLKSRTAMVSGKMHCYSSPGRGTEYLFEIPLKQKDEQSH